MYVLNRAGCIGIRNKKSICNKKNLIKFTGSFITIETI